MCVGDGRSLGGGQDEISFILFTSLREDDDDCDDVTDMKKPELDIAVHVQHEQGQMKVAIHSPYWMVNKTGRLLQYKADDIHRKHPLDYDMPLLFSFKPRYFLKNNKVRGEDGELRAFPSLYNNNQHISVNGCYSSRSFNNRSLSFGTLTGSRDLKDISAHRNIILASSESHRY